MRYFDLHCDTLFKATIDNSDLHNTSYHISLKKLNNFEKYKQMFALWIPDNYAGESATVLFNKMIQKYRLISNDIDFDSYLAVENASMLNGDLDNVKLLVDNKIKYVTLTWNGDNQLGSGAFGKSDIGLTGFGQNIIKKLEDNQIAVDVSHSSDKMFYDVIKIAHRPVIATHSNSRFITDNKRNMTDEQFKIIRDMNGIVGLNFYKAFLNNDEDEACIDDIIRHAYHFLNLGGENTLAIGADFDGADMPYDICGIQTVPYIYTRFCDEFGAKLTKKVFFDNANMYFRNFDIIV